MFGLELESYVAGVGRVFVIRTGTCDDAGRCEESNERSPECLCLYPVNFVPNAARWIDIVTGGLDEAIRQVRG